MEKRPPAASRGWYEKSTFGPVPEGVDFLLKAAKIQGAVELEEKTYRAVYPQPLSMAAFLTQSTGPMERLLEVFSKAAQIRIYPRGEVDSALFSPGELRVLRFIVERMGGRNLPELQKAVSAEKAFRETGEREFIPYEEASSLTLSLPPEESTSFEDA